MRSSAVRMVESAYAWRLQDSMQRESGAELVIALTHMRVPNDERLAREVSGIDLILGGHDHHYEVKVVEGSNTLLCKSGTDFRDLTLVHIRFGAGGPKIERHEHVEITKHSIVWQALSFEDRSSLVHRCSDFVPA